MTTMWCGHHLEHGVSELTCDVLDRYIMFLKSFLETAEQHFFVGFDVHMYVFTDRPEEVPPVKMAARRQVSR